MISGVLSVRNTEVLHTKLPLISDQFCFAFFRQKEKSLHRESSHDGCAHSLLVMIVNKPRILRSAHFVRKCKGPNQNPRFSRPSASKHASAVTSISKR